MSIKFQNDPEALPGQLAFNVVASVYQKQNGDLLPHQRDDSADANKGNIGMDGSPARPNPSPIKNLRGGK